MARPSFLDQNLLSKIGRKIGKSSTDLQPIRGMVARRASKLGISSEAALVLIAGEHGIGTAAYLRTLDSSKQAEIRDSRSFFVQQPSRPAQPSHNSRPSDGKPMTDRELWKAATESLIQDGELKDRCQDLLLAKRNFDRAINQATLVLEDRIREKAKPQTKLVGEALVNFAFKEDLTRTVLQVKGGDSDDQRGCTQILRGVVPLLRNKTHHHIVDDFSRGDALRVCGFIDVLLRIVDDSVKVS